MKNILDINTQRIYEKESPLANFEYKKWLSKLSGNKRKTIKDFSSIEIDYSFSTPLFFNSSGLTASLGLGTSLFNEYTINHISKAISIFLKKTKTKKILFTTNNRKNISFLMFLIEIFNANGIETVLFDDWVKTEGQFNFVLSKSNNVFGLYLSDEEESFNIKLFNNFGREFSFLEYTNINSIIKEQEFEFSFSKKAFSALKKEFINPKMEDLYYKSTFLINFSQFKDNTIVIVSQSDAVSELFEKLKKLNLFNLVCFRNPKVIKDLSNASAFQAGYKFARKEKENIIFAFDSRGEKFNIAIKIGKIFKFLTYIEFTSIMIEAFKTKKSIKLDYLLPKGLNALLIKEKPQKDSYFSTNFKNSLNSFFYYDPFPVFVEFASKYLNDNKYFQRLISQINKKIGFISMSKTEKIYEKNEFNEFIENIQKHKKMGQMLINKISFLLENKIQTFINIRTNECEIILFYNKNSKILEIFYFSINKNLIDAISKKGETLEIFEAYSNNKSDVEQFFTKKKIISLFISFSIITLILFLVFTYIFNWDQIIESFNIIRVSWGEVFFYILFANLIIIGVPGSLVAYFSVKLFRKEANFWHFYIATIISIFFYSITPLSIFGLGFWVWFLRTKGYKTSELIPVASTMLLTTTIISMTYQSSMFAYSYFYLLEFNIPDIYWTFSLGAIAIVMLWVGNSMLFLAAYSRRFQNFLLSIIERFFFFIGYTKKYNKYYEKFTSGAENNKNNINLIIKNKSFMFMAILVMWSSSVFNELLFFSSLNLVAQNSGEPLLTNFFGLASVNVLCASAAQIIQLNSGVVVYEVIMKSVISTLYTNPEIATQTTFLYRFFTFYGIILITAIPFVFFMLKINNQKNKKSLIRSKWD